MFPTRFLVYSTVHSMMSLGHREVVDSCDIPYPYIVQDPYLWSPNSQQRMSQVILCYVVLCLQYRSEMIHSNRILNSFMKRLSISIKCQRHG